MSGDALFARSLERLEAVYKKAGKKYVMVIDDRERYLVKKLGACSFVRVGHLKHADVQIVDDETQKCLLAAERKRCDDLQAARVSGKFEKQRQSLQQWAEPLFKWYIVESPCWLREEAVVQQTLERYPRAFQTEQSTVLSTMLRHRMFCTQTRDAAHTCHLLVDALRVLLDLDLSSSTDEESRQETTMLAASKEKVHFAGKKSRALAGDDGVLGDRVASLAVIKGISPAVSHCVVKRYPSFLQLCNEIARDEQGTRQKIADIEIASARQPQAQKKRRVGKATAAKIVAFFKDTV
jgi:ERCC4-type nuclease